jgi:hypothetical protein
MFALQRYSDMGVMQPPGDAAPPLRHGLARAKDFPGLIAAAPRGLEQRQGGHEILGRPRHDM